MEELETQLNNTMVDPSPQPSPQGEGDISGEGNKNRK